MNDKPKSRKTLENNNIKAWDKLYEATNDYVWGKQASPFLRDILRDIVSPIPTEYNILDAATGEGRNLPYLVSTGAHVYACDSSVHALSKIDHDIKGKVEITECTLGKTPYKNGKFDIVLLWDVVETLPAPEAVLKEIYRITSKGGHLICNIPGKDDGIAKNNMTILNDGGNLYDNRFYYKFYNKLEAWNLLQSAGFKIDMVNVFEWAEEAHPGFRSYAHVHKNEVFTVSK